MQEHRTCYILHGERPFEYYGPGLISSRRWIVAVYADEAAARSAQVIYTSGAVVDPSWDRTEEGEDAVYSIEEAVYVE